VNILQAFLELKFWNNTILDYLIFLGSLAASFIVLLVFKRIILRRLVKWAEKTPTSLDDMLLKAFKRYLLPLLYVGALYLNTKWLKLSDGAEDVINVIALAAVMILGAVIISSLLIYLLNKYFEKRQREVNKAAMRWIGALIKAIVWVGALLLFLDNRGVKITTLVAGLGIGGIAVAFAAQAVLEDIFSFVTIFFDRPFEIDDFIIIDNLSGTVEHIGIKTTRVRSISGEQLIFSNKDLTNSRVRNYKRMLSRRVAFSLGVTYDTPLDKLKEIPALIKQIIDAVDQTDFSRAHFKEFADSSLNIEVVYFVLSQDYDIYMDVQQDINFGIKEAFDARGIEFAFPTQTLYLQQ
jgi:small-conductance mechanosensitive channel